jgi:tRNA pseudouridine38-40 synthase
MRRIKIHIKYDGYGFSGFQRQDNERTVQGVIELALGQIHNTSMNLVGASRTDAGVHAKGMICHFDTFLDMDSEAFKRALNSLVPDDVYIIEADEVSQDFHARFDAKQKTYEYIINLGEYNPIERNHVYQYNKALDVLSMERALGYLVGTHDFTTFSSYKEGEKENRVRTIQEAEIERQDQKIIIRITGDGFLRYMIRIIVGTLVEMGEGKRKPESMIKLIDDRDRGVAAPTFSPVGLYLMEVKYQDN